jgi:hypothetical protein
MDLLQIHQARPKLRYYGGGGGGGELVLLLIRSARRTFAKQMFSREIFFPDNDLPPVDNFLGKKTFPDQSVKLRMLPLPFFTIFPFKVSGICPKTQIFSHIFVNLSKFSLQLLLFDKLC